MLIEELKAIKLNDKRSRESCNSSINFNHNLFCKHFERKKNRDSGLRHIPPNKSFLLDGLKNNFIYCADITAYNACGHGPFCNSCFEDILIKEVNNEKSDNWWLRWLFKRWVKVVRLLYAKSFTLSRSNFNFGYF